MREQIARATLTNLATGVPLAVQFNPESLRWQKGANWAEIRIPGLNFPKLHWVSGNAKEIPLRLEFDTEGMDDLTPILSYFEQLVMKDRDAGRPPLTRFVWGPQAYEAIVTEVQIEVDAFRADGAPTSAVVNLTLREYNEAEVIVESRSRPEEEPRQYVVKQGDTLSGISHSVYGDTSKWRMLAEANGIADPRRLQVGARLTLPPRSEVLAS